MKNILLFTALCALMTACGSSQSEQQWDTAAAPADGTGTDAINQESDSAASSNLSAVAHQPQIDTSATNIGTDKSGGLVAKGVKLINGSDCTSCHREQDLLVGPAYKAVAQKYPATEANIDYLAKKIIQGGKGNWGEIPMTPHPDLSVADAQEMVRYILSIK